MAIVRLLRRSRRKTAGCFSLPAPSAVSSHLGSFHARTGTGRIEGDFPMRDGPYCSSRARAFAEDMRLSRARSGVARTASRFEIEEQRAKYLRSLKTMNTCAI